MNEEEGEEKLCSTFEEIGMKESLGRNFPNDLGVRLCKTSYVLTLSEG